MTTAKKRAAPQPVTEPAVPSDVAFGNVITAARDAAVVAHQALQNDKITREEFYDREAARLKAARTKEIGSLEEQLAQQARIQAGCDAALEALKGTNVVQLSGQAA